MKKKIKINDNIEKSFRSYRRLTLNFVFIAICISIWSTMMTKLTWTFSDIAFEGISLLIITICGMLGNVENRFSLFHLRGIRITRERLISMLIGVLFPVSFIIYFMVTDNEFMKYLNTISLHDFITLSVLLIPIMIIIALIIYFSYVVIEPKYSREKRGEYAIKTEKSLDEHKMVCLTFICLLAFSSIWIKLSYNYEWTFTNIKTEIIVIIILAIMKIISNLKNRLPWNYSQRLGYSKYLYICLIVPYLVFGIVCLISPGLRDDIMLTGIPKTISLIVSYSPLVGLAAVIVSSFAKIVGRVDERTKSLKVTQKNKNLRHENIVISLALSLFAIMLILIYIMTSVITNLNMDLLIKTLLMLVPVGVIIYLVIYYSIITINK